MAKIDHSKLEAIMNLIDFSRLLRAREEALAKKKMIVYEEEIGPLVGYRARIVVDIDERVHK